MKQMIVRMWLIRLKALCKTKSVFRTFLIAKLFFNIVTNPKQNEWKMTLFYSFGCIVIVLYYCVSINVKMFSMKILELVSSVEGIIEHKINRIDWIRFKFVY